jgi:site-specific DNA recombinase
LHGEARTAQLGLVSRVPAPDIEQAIVSALRKHLTHDQPRGEMFDRTTLATLVYRIEVQRTSFSSR